MYDSRTDHPYYPGRHSVGHAGRWERKDRWRDGTVVGQPRAAAALVVAEGLDDHEGVEFAYGPDCEWDDLMVPVVDPLIDWSHMGWLPQPVAVIGVEVDPYEEAYDAGDLVFDEVGLLVLPTTPAWSSDDAEAYAAHNADWDEDEDGVVTYYGDPAQRVDVYVDKDGEEYHAGPIEDLDADTEWTSWLPLMTYDEACEELSYGFTVEGPSPQPEPLREGNYVRVYQLARDLGVDSKPLVAHLREIGEYVTTHQSWVANPVADRLRADNALAPLAWALGERTTATTGTQRLDALIREEDQRARRVGPNPFADYTMLPRPGAPRSDTRLEALVP